MHSYQHNIKTFNSATMHLTHVERSLYRCLIELYYDTEQPLPADDFERLARRVLAQSDEEKAALKFVLDEFFELTGNVYTHDYCDEVIEKYHNSIAAKARAGKASAETRKKKAEERKNKRKTDAQQNSTGVQQVFNERSTHVLNKKPETNINTPHTPQGGRNEYPPEFEEFWNAYPKKVGKGAAFKRWKKIKPSADLRARMLWAVAHQSRSEQWTRQGGQFIPDPARWLNESRWDDETQEKSSSGGFVA